MRNVVMKAAVLLLAASVLLTAQIAAAAIPGCPTSCTCEWPDDDGEDGDTLLQVMCPGFPASLPERSNLTVRGAKTGTLRQSDLNGIRTAHSLHLTGLGITTLSPGTVQMTSLRTLSLSGNQLSRISDGAFRWCPRLESLDLSGNRLKNVSERAFEGLTTLRHLSLADNRLEDLDPASLPITLNSLNLSRNLLHDPTRLPPTADGRLGGLTRLDLCGNDLRNFVVSPNRAPHLSELCVGDAVTDLQVDTSDESALDALRTLQVTGKTENGSESVLTAVLRFRNLRSLTLSHLDLGEITTRMTDALTRLSRLRLTHVESGPGFADDALAALAIRLRLLDLEGSPALVQSLFNATTANSSPVILPNLRILSFAGTGINSIPASFLTRTAPDLVQLDLGGNPLTCDPSFMAELLTAVLAGRIQVSGQCASPTDMAGRNLTDPRVVLRVLGGGAGRGSHPGTVEEYLDSLGVTPAHLFYVALGLVVLVLLLVMALLVVGHMRRRRGARRDDGSPGRGGCCGAGGSSSDGSGEGFMMRADSEYTFDNFTLSDTLSESRRSAAASRESTMPAKARKNSNRK